MSALEFFGCYFILISVITAAVTVVDKQNAKRGGRRIPEDLLLTLGLLGGAFAEYITMKLIHHKTRHIKFMLGLPLEILIHIAIVVFVLIYA